MTTACRPGIGVAVACALAVCGAMVTAGQGWQPKPEVVSATAARQPTFNYDEARVGALPLPLALGEGRDVVRTPLAWQARRRVLLEQFRDHVYGRSPGRPLSLRFDVTEEDRSAMAGAATRLRVAIVSGESGRSHRFDLILFLPNRRLGKVPVFLFLNNRPVSNTDPTRRERSGFWPAEQVIDAGYGIAAIQNNDLAPDDKDRFTEGAIQLFEGRPASARPDRAWGAIAAWAWGASRAMDYLVTHPRIDASRVAVVGHSRGGKAALWAGASDTRFALVVSNESGEGGAALSRRWYGETVARINESFPHWFASSYKAYAGREAELPVDQHLLLALVAPRALYVASADEDLWSDPRGEFLALAHSSPVFALWGDPAILDTGMPALNSPIRVGRRGYHVRTGIHDLTPYDWARFTDFATALWR